MTADLILALCAFAFVSSITPGPNNLMLMASGTNFGLVRTVPHMLGVTIGFVVMVVLMGAGLASVFAAFPVAHTVLKVVSLVYLLYLAWKIATAPAPQAAAQTGGAKPFTFVQAALFQWVNPKAWAMVLTAVTAYTVPAQPVASLLLITLVFGLINLPSVWVWVFLGVQMRRFLDDPAKLRAFNITAALLLVASLYPIVFGGSH